MHAWNLPTVFLKWFFEFFKISFQHKSLPVLPYDPGVTLCDPGDTKCPRLPHWVLQWHLWKTNLNLLYKLRFLKPAGSISSLSSAVPDVPRPPVPTANYSPQRQSQWQCLVNRPTRFSTNQNQGPFRNRLRWFWKNSQILSKFWHFLGLFWNFWIWNFLALSLQTHVRTHVLEHANEQNVPYQRTL